MENLKKILLGLVFIGSLASPEISRANENAPNEIVYYEDYDLDEAVGLKSQNKPGKNNEADENSTEDDNFTIAQVKRVIDGDTIEVSCQNTDHKLRMIGVDTPETVHPSKPVEHFGKEASAFTKKTLTGATVYLESDISQTDRYGRLLRYVWLEKPKSLKNPSFEEVRDKMFNGILLRDGYAKVSTYAPDVKYEDIFLKIGREAEINSRGLYKDYPKASDENQEANTGENRFDNIKESDESLAPNRSEKFPYPRGDRPTTGQVRVWEEGKDYKADKTQGPIKGNRRTGVYHLQGQRDYNKISVNNVTWFYSEKEAIEKNYRKAKR